ncbi:MAG: ECF transporter S component [Oscillospiraceae bacterium]|nr:ECF transporter S component [Oscillospiraceae bacterium]
MKNNNVRTLVLAALFLALGLVLPFFTGQIPQIGQMLCPMHLPVLLCGLICGWQWGGLVGFLTPLLRSLLFGMPPIFPTGIAMAFELLTYGVVIGLLYAHMKRQNIGVLYLSLVLAMISGRVVWGIVRVILSGVAGTAFTWQMYLSGALLTAIPGIILQLVLIPAIMVALDKSGLYRMKQTA